MPRAQNTSREADAARHKLLTWIAILLVWFIVLAIVAIGYVLYGRSSTPVAADCAAQNAQITDLTARCSEAAAASSAATTKSVAGNGIHPGFSYPSSWSVYGVPNQNLSYTVKASPDAILECDGCDGVFSPVVITTAPRDEVLLKKFVSFEAYANSLYADTNIFTNIKIVAIPGFGIEAFSVTGHEKGMGEADIEEIRVLTAKNTVTVRYSTFDGNADIAAGWKTIKDSLDFSKIE